MKGRDVVKYWKQAQVSVKVLPGEERGKMWGFQVHVIFSAEWETKSWFRACVG